MLMGVLPNSQFGDVAVINLGKAGSIPVGLGSDSAFCALGSSTEISSASAFASTAVKPLGSIAGGLLGIGSSVIQNSQNRQNVQETNRMNYKINQMNNQFNERMAIQQRDWQENMWNKENAYNTASAQRQRLEEAGLNPYLMMNGGSAGVAQSAGAGASASSSGSAVMQPFQADYSGIGSSIGNIFQYELMQSEKSQLQGARQLADAKAMETLSNIDWGKLTRRGRQYYSLTALIPVDEVSRNSGSV
jgi:hypothetical protein